MKNLLTCDINRLTHMSYDSRQRCSKGRATQSGSHPPPRACATSRGCRTLGSRVVGDQASSLSLSAACSATPTTRCGARCQGLLYGQALAPFGGHAPDLRRLDRFDPERDRQPRRASDSPSWGRPWLTTRGVGNARCGVELVFLKAPSGATPEDQLLLQFQGMIAEYERAQIA